jgi:hypothetical protein
LFKWPPFQAQRGDQRWGQLGSRPLVIGLEPRAVLLLKLGVAWALFLDLCHAFLSFFSAWFSC